MFTVGGLFSGIGGIELGFERAGFNILWSNENDSSACKTYRANFKNHNLIEKDINDIDIKKLTKVDIITAGFPCQAFSVAGYQKGFKDSRGNLFFNIIDVVKEISPKVIFLENVKNLKSHDSGKTFKIICNELRKLNYSIFAEVLNTSEHTSIPQNRERIFIICFRNESNWVATKNSYSRFFHDIFPPKKKTSPKSFRSFLETKNIDDKFYYNQSAYMYNELRKHIVSKDTVYQWRRIYVRANKSNMCPTLTANMGTGGHNVPLILDNFGIRKLTPRECFNLQGFPKTFKLPIDCAQSQLYKQAGNSVTVDLITKISVLIKKTLNENKFNNKSLMTA